MWDGGPSLLSGQIAGDVNVTSGAGGDGGAGADNCDPANTMQMTAATTRPAKIHLTTDQVVPVNVGVGPAGSGERWLAAGLMLSILKIRNGGIDRRRNERRIRICLDCTACHCSTVGDWQHKQQSSGTARYRRRAFIGRGIVLVPLGDVGSAANSRTPARQEAR